MRALVALALIGALCGCDPSTRRLLDTPQEHQERLACEMREMSETHMSADNAEAYCDKLMEASQSYKRGS